MSADYQSTITGTREKLDQLLAKARELPKRPGVYLMKDAQGVAIYVGKAGRLADRVSSYFVPSADLGPKKQQLLDFVDEFETIECEGNWEALLTENRLIKDLHPRFNARLTDDKTFPYLVVTTREDFPGVYITREPNSEPFRGSKTFGPFTSVYALRESIQLLQRVFKFRTCHLEIEEPRDSQRVDITVEAKGPAQIDNTGQGSQAKAEGGSSRELGRSVPDRSAAKTAKGDPRRYFRPCLLHPIGQCTAPCAAKISKADYREDINRFVKFLGSKRSVMLREMRTEMQRASEAWEFERAAALRDQIRAVEQLDERGKQSQGWQPETESLVDDPKKGLESLRKTLGIDEPIRVVECIDIAHLQGGETVGSKVCFVDGRPFKDNYRRYKIKTAQAGDDYMAIREVVSRRYREAGKGHELYPDVIVIDGGLGQLHAAEEAIAQLEHKPPMVISLAKKEELIHTQARHEPIKLGRNNLGLKLCQAIRDEAHRFAQHYHHILRRKKMLGEKKS